MIFRFACSLSQVNFQFFAGTLALLTISAMLDCEIIY